MNELKPMTRCCLCGNRINPIDGRIVCCGISNPIPRKLRKFFVKSTPSKGQPKKWDELDKILEATKLQNHFYSYWSLPDNEES